MDGIEESAEQKAVLADAQDPSMKETEFVRLKKIVLAGARKRSKWRPKAKRAYRFTAGYHWEEEDKNLLDEQNRLAVSFNRCAPIINAVCGMEENSRQELLYMPREEGDGKVNETITATAKWARQGTYANEKESRAFRDLAITGEGWMETRMDYDIETMGKIGMYRVNPLEVGTDEDACEENYEDARLIFRVRDMGALAAEDLLGNKYSSRAIDAGWFGKWETPEDGGAWDKKDYPDQTRAGLAGGTQAGKTRVVQIWWYETVKFKLVSQFGEDEQGNKLDPTIIEMSAADFKKYEKRAKMAGIEYDSADGSRRVYYTAFLGASALLNKTRLDVDCFPLTAMTGYYDEEEKMFYGMLHDLFDPQMWANKALSQILQILSLMAKGGLMAETDAFVNTKKAEEQWSDPTKIIWVKPGKLEKVKERTPVQVPQGLNDLLQFSISSLRDVSGVNLELLGQANREQAASLEAQRRESAMNILAVIFSSLRKYRMIQAKVLLKFIWLLPNGTLVRVLDKGQHKYIPFMKEGDTLKYDIIADQTPVTTNQKQTTWIIIRDLLATGIQIPPEVTMKLLKYSPLPESVVEEVLKAMGMGADGQQPPEMLAQKLEQAEAALKVMEEKLTEAIKEADTLEQKIGVDLMKAAVDEFRAETERMKVEWETSMNTAQSNAKAEQMGSITGGQGSGRIQEGSNEPEGDDIKQQLQTLMQAVQMIADKVGAMAGPTQEQQMQPGNDAGIVEGVNNAIEQ